MPGVAVFFTIACLSSLGLPGTAGFVSEFLVFLGAWQSGHWSWAIPGMLGGLRHGDVRAQGHARHLLGPCPGGVASAPVGRASHRVGGARAAGRGSRRARLVASSACSTPSTPGAWTIWGTAGRGAGPMSELRTLWLPAWRRRAGHARALARRPRSLARRTPGRDLAVGWLVHRGIMVLFGGDVLRRRVGARRIRRVRGGRWTTFVQRLVLGGGTLGALGAIDDVAARTPRRQGEYWLLMLSSLLGMVLLPGARDLVLVVVAFELMGIPLYVLAAYAKNETRARPGRIRARASRPRRR